jgi:hypothetical protein
MVRLLPCGGRTLCSMCAVEGAPCPTCGVLIEEIDWMAIA